MKITIAAWIGSNNLGDELILMSLLNQLQANGVALEDITAISKAPKMTSERFAINSIDHFSLFGVFNAIRNSDILIFGGGGILQDDTSIWNLPYHLSRIWIAQILGKKIITVGVGAGPIDTKLGRWLTRNTFNNKKFLFVRDVESKELLASIGISNITVGPDLVFSLPRINLPAKGYIAAALRPYSPKGGLLPVSMRNSKSDDGFLIDIAKALDETSIKAGLPIRFISFDSDKDVEFQQKIAALMNTEVTFSTPSPSDVADEIGGANVVIGMRFHSAVLAILAGRPSVLIGYSPKVKSLATLMDQGCKIIENKMSAYKKIPTLVTLVLGKDDEVRKVREQLILESQEISRSLSIHLK